MFRYRPYIHDDGELLTALQQRYARRHPGVDVIPAAVYASPSFDGGRNVICAFDEQGRLAGYAPIYPVLVEDPLNPSPHTLWAEVRVEPGLENGPALRSQLFKKILARGRQIASRHPLRPAQLTFQYHAIEAESIAFVVSHGCEMGDGIFQMERDLTQPVPEAPLYPGISLRPWRMESLAEQEQYVAARNLSFPEAPISLAEWQYFLQSPQWASGVVISAFAGHDLVGGVLVYPPLPGEPQTACTESIFVTPAWQKRGLGTCLVAAALRYLQSRGCRRAVLEVKARNDRALNLYRALGYVTRKETRLFTLNL